MNVLFLLVSKLLASLVMFITMVSFIPHELTFSPAMNYIDFFFFQLIHSFLPVPAGTSVLPLLLLLLLHPLINPIYQVDGQLLIEQLLLPLPRLCLIFHPAEHLSHVPHLTHAHQNRTERVQLLIIFFPSPVFNGHEILLVTVGTPVKQNYVFHLTSKLS